jgi:hypothetical protein
MEEKFAFYENFYIPLLKKRIADMSVAIPEIEATILFFKDKCAKLESENALLKDHINKISNDNSLDYK